MAGRRDSGLGSFGFFVAVLMAVLLALMLTRACGPASASSPGAGPPPLINVADLPGPLLQCMEPELPRHSSGAIGVGISEPVLLGSGILPPPYSPPDLEERRLIAAARIGCPVRSRPDGLDVWTALLLLRLEVEEGLSPPLRGITLAAWCSEAGYTTDAVGDGGLAVGAFQLHRGELWRWCGRPDRRNVEQAGRCWLRRIVAVATGKAATRCGSRRAWQAAQLWVAAGPQGYRCDQDSSHLRRLRRYRHSIRSGALQ